MAENIILTPAAELAAKNKAQFPNESTKYRRAATPSLLRRSNSGATSNVSPRCVVLFPPAVRSPKTMPSKAHGAVHLSQLFGDKDTLVIYSMMFGPQRKRACPMCTAMLTSWDGTSETCANVSLSPSPHAPRSSAFSISKKNGAGRIYRCTPIRKATTPAPMSAPKMATSQVSASSLAEMAQYATSGAER